MKLKKRIEELEANVERLKRFNKSLRTTLDQPKKEQKQFKRRLNNHVSTASKKNEEVEKEICQRKTTTEFVDREKKSRLKTKIGVRRGEDQVE